jgi:hypothetical protein
MERLSLNIVIPDKYHRTYSMTSMIHPALSLGEGSNGLDALFNTISPFSDADPIMRGIRDGTMSWADAAELEEAEAAARLPVAPFTPPTTSAWAATPPLVRQVAGGTAPTTPPRPRVTFACPGGAPLARPCPGAPARPLFKKPLTYAKPCKTIILRNLPRDSDDLDTVLRTAFSPYGTVRDVYIPKNMDVSSPYFGTIKGFALVKFAELSAAEAAETAGSLRIGRNNLSVEFAKEDR